MTGRRRRRGPWRTELGGAQNRASPSKEQSVFLERRTPTRLTFPTVSVLCENPAAPGVINRMTNFTRKASEIGAAFSTGLYLQAIPADCSFLGAPKFKPCAASLSQRLAEFALVRSWQGCIRLFCLVGREARCGGGWGQLSLYLWEPRQAVSGQHGKVWLAGSLTINRV